MDALVVRVLGVVDTHAQIVRLVWIVVIRTTTIDFGIVVVSTGRHTASRSWAGSQKG